MAWTISGSAAPDHWPPPNYADARTRFVCGSNPDGADFKQSINCDSYIVYYYHAWPDAMVEHIG